MQQGGLLCSHSTSEGVKGLTEGAGLFPAGFLPAYHLLLAHGESGPGCGWAAVFKHSAQGCSKPVLRQESVLAGRFSLRCVRDRWESTAAEESSHTQAKGAAQCRGPPCTPVLKAVFMEFPELGGAHGDHPV